MGCSSFVILPRDVETHASHDDDHDLKFIINTKGMEEVGDQAGGHAPGGPQSWCSSCWPLDVEHGNGGPLLFYMWDLNVLVGSSPP